MTASERVFDQDIIMIDTLYGTNTRGVDNGLGLTVARGADKANILRGTRLFGGISPKKQNR